MLLRLRSVFLGCTPATQIWGGGGNPVGYDEEISRDIWRSDCQLHTYTVYTLFSSTRKRETLTQCWANVPRLLDMSVLLCYSLSIQCSKLYKYMGGWWAFVYSAQNCTKTWWVNITIFAMGTQCILADVLTFRISPSVTVSVFRSQCPVLYQSQQGLNGYNELLMTIGTGSSQM